jgi:hypothetical protein
MFRRVPGICKAGKPLQDDGELVAPQPGHGIVAVLEVVQG